MLLDVDEARTLITTTLGDEALTLLLGAAEEAIDEAVGPLSYDDTADAEERHRPHGDLLMLSRRATLILSVEEDGTTLAADDYALRPGGLSLRRLADGTNPRSVWWPPVTVTYAPISDLDRRKRAQAQLTQLYLSYRPGVSSQTIGPWSEAYGQMRDLLSQQGDILASIRGGFEGIR